MKLSRWFVLFPLLLMCSQTKTLAAYSPAELRTLASDYYRWQAENDPVSSSDQGLHTWDAKLGDYSEDAIAARRQHVRELLAKVNSMHTEAWAKDDRIDWLLLRAQLERDAFFARVLDFEHTNPEVYADECGNA